MFKAIGWLIKVSLFTVLVLVLGNSVHLGARTVNDQIRIQLAHAERSNTAEKMKDWASDWMNRLKRTLHLSSRAPVIHETRDVVVESSASPERQGPSLAGNPVGAPMGEVAPSEKQKLRALIRELNSSHRHESK